MNETIRVAIDESRCAGHGRCYALAPELFAPDDGEGFGQVIAQPDGDMLDTARRAVQNCPEQAVRLEQRVDPIKVDNFQEAR